MFGCSEHADVDGEPEPTMLFLFYDRQLDALDGRAGSLSIQTYGYVLAFP